MSEQKNTVAGNFRCHVEVNEQLESAFARIHVASQDIEWGDNSVTIEYLSLYLTLEIEGSQFDVTTLVGTSNVAIDNEVIIKDSEGKDGQKKESASVDVNANSKGTSAGFKLGTESTDTEKQAQEVEGKYNDLLWNLENPDARCPKWKISQRNPSSLVLSLGDKTKLGEFDDMSNAAGINVTGHTSTGRKGVGFRVVMNHMPGRYKIFGAENFWRQIIEKKIEKLLVNSKIPVEQVMA